jgi:two-component system, NarL family, response regulator NreC
MCIGLLLADDSDVVRHAITQMLRSRPEVKVLGEARCFAEVFQKAVDLKPTVVLMDLHMPDEREVNPELVKTGLQNCTKHVVAISIWNDEEARAFANSYGASILLDKSTLASELIPTITQYS